MNLLAIETSATACSLALYRGDQLFSHHQIVPRGQAKVILAWMDTLLISAEIELRDLTAIAFGCGPGSFTGIRLATSVAQGLGYATRLPLVPVSSLAALAQTIVDEKGWQQLAVAIDARMQEIFWGIYTVGASGLVTRQAPEELCKPDQIALSLPGEWYGVGSGWETFYEALVQKIGFLPTAIDAVSLPTARGVARLAQAYYRNGVFVSAEEAQPVYLRNKVVFSSS